MFVSQASIKLGIVETYGIKKRVEAVKNCRNIGKKDMKYNNAMPKMKVDPESYVSGFLNSSISWLLYCHIMRYFKSLKTDILHLLVRLSKRMECCVKRSRHPSYL